MLRLSLVFAVAFVGCEKEQASAPTSAPAEAPAEEERAAPAEDEEDPPTSKPKSVVGMHRDAQTKSACVETQRLRSAIEMFVVSNGACPKSLQHVVDAQMIQSEPIDPWDNPFTFFCTDDEIHVTSAGPDGENGTADDIADDTCAG